MLQIQNLLSFYCRAKLKFLIFNWIYYTCPKTRLIENVFTLTQWRSKGRGASGGTRPGAQALGAHQHTFAVI